MPSAWQEPMNGGLTGDAGNPYVNYFNILAMNYTSSP
jgi:hypothetical protein